MSEYAALADVKARMPELGTSDDAVIESLIFAASAYFETCTGRTFGNETKLQVFSGNGTSQLFMHPPLASTPTLVRVRSNSSDSWRTITSDVRVMPEGRRTGDPVLWLEIRDTPTGTDSVFPAANDTVEVTGTWGRTAVPDDIKEACIQTVVNLYRSRGSAGSDMEVGVGGTYMPDIPKAIPAFAYTVLRSYKRLVLA